jgi:Ribbon-helix-helix protein, copG family
MNTTTLEEPQGVRLSRRIVILEEPGVAEAIERLARENGSSVGGEIRRALRYWLQIYEDEE